MSGFGGYQQCDATALAARIRSGEVSREDVLQASLAQLDAVNPRINAVVHDMRGQAAASLPGLPDGPFTGVPFIVKALLSDCAGEPIGAGTRLLQTVRAAADSELVMRYRKAGLVIVGRSNTPELGLTSYTEPAVSGATCNPWQPGLTAGGSSGGSAAAVAAGIVPMAGGGDGGGSIRIPAAFCGLFGLKPSRARVPSGPWPGIPWHGLVQEHVITRSVRDSAAMLDAVHGVDAGAPCAAPSPVRPFLAEVGAPPGRLRIAYTARALFGKGRADADSVAALEDAVALLGSLGHELVEATPALDAEAVARAFFVMVAAEARADIEWVAKTAGVRARMADFEPPTWVLGLLGQSFGADRLANACRVLDGAAREMGRFHAGFDLLLTPTMAAPPHPHGALQPKPAEHLLMRVLGRLGSGHVFRALGVVDEIVDKAFAALPYTPLFNATGQPAASLPLYWNPEGLPVGVQLAAAYGREDLLFRVASQLEAARPWFARRPTLASAP